MLHPQVEVRGEEQDEPFRIHNQLQVKGSFAIYLHSTGAASLEDHSVVGLLEKRNLAQSRQSYLIDLTEKLEPRQFSTYFRMQKEPASTVYLATMSVSTFPVTTRRSISAPRSWSKYCLSHVSCIIRIAPNENLLLVC